MALKLFWNLGNSPSQDCLSILLLVLSGLFVLYFTGHIHILYLLEIGKIVVLA